MRSEEPDAPTTVRYADVKLVEDKRRNAKTGDLLIGMGAAAVGAAIFVFVATAGHGLSR